MTEQDVWAFAMEAGFVLAAFVVTPSLLILGMVWSVARMREASRP